MPKVHVGISGWTYPPWRNGRFYPKEWPQKRELEYASRQVNSIEINGTFYSLQRPASFKKWREGTPQGFVFSVKASRYITHLRRLRDIGTPLANFFASGVLRLKEKLGPFLWQLPPSFVYDREVMEEFFKQLPRTMAAAGAIAKKHDKFMKGRIWTGPLPRRRLRHAIEVRHHSFQNAEFIQLLRDQGVAIVVADTAGKWPLIEDVTGDFVYVRLHGDEELYASGYTAAALRKWERKIRSWSQGSSPRGAETIARRLPKRSKGRDVFVYFDNDVKVHAPFDAMSLAKRLGLRAKRPAGKTGRNGKSSALAKRDT